MKRLKEFSLREREYTLACWFIAALSFAIWQESVFAGVWMFSLPIVSEFVIHG